eukprot:403350684
MKQGGGTAQSASKAAQSNLNQNSTDPIVDMNQEIQRELKRRGDTAVHQAALDGDVTLLKELLKRGMPVFNPSDADGGTPLHRAAESCAIECAKVLLEKNADIDALNSMGQTPFHVCAEKQDFVFAKFLLKNRARRNCRPGCLKCRLFMKQIERYDKSQKDLEQQQQEAKLEEEKVKDQKKKEKKKNRNNNKESSRPPELDLLEELQRCREEAGGGPFFNKKENLRFREQQDQIRLQEEMRQQKLRSKNSLQAVRDSNMDQLTDMVPIQKIAQLLSTVVVEIEQIKPQNRGYNKNEQTLYNTDLKQSKSISQPKELIKTQNYQPIKHQSLTTPHPQPFLSSIQKQSTLGQNFENLKLSDHQVPSPITFYQPNFKSSQDEKLSQTPRKKRQKRLEDLEEEKFVHKSQDSINYNSDGELQPHYM